MGRLRTCCPVLIIPSSASVPVAVKIAFHHRKMVTLSQLFSSVPLGFGLIPVVCLQSLLSFGSLFISDVCSSYLASEAFVVGAVSGRSGSKALSPCYHFPMSLNRQGSSAPMTSGWFVSGLMVPCLLRAAFEMQHVKGDICPSTPLAARTHL